MRVISEIIWWLLAVWLAGYATLRPSNQSFDAPITVRDLIVFVVLLAILTLLDKITARIAARKGGSYVKWAYYGLLLPYIALPHALLKKAPSRG